jgi:glutaminyl-tRNA synthetase
VKATLHWVAAPTALQAEIRLYDHLFVKPDPDDVEPGENYLANLNPDALKVVMGVAEPSVANAAPGTRYQFERLGCFCVDTDSAPGKPVYNRTVTLRDTWAKIEKAQKTGG